MFQRLITRVNMERNVHVQGSEIPLYSTHSLHWKIEKKNKERGWKFNVSANIEIWNKTLKLSLEHESVLLSI